MTLLDANGRPVGEEDVQWMAPCIFRWLDDARLRQVMIARGVFGTQIETFEKIRWWGGLLQASMRDDVPVKPVVLRKIMLDLLKDRVVRRKLASKILQDEALVRIEFHEYLEARTEAIGRGKEPPEPMDEPPQPRSRHEVMKEMVSLHDELQQRIESESLIIRPNA